jgi:hypothetical protein
MREGIMICSICKNETGYDLFICKSCVSDIEQKKDKPVELVFKIDSKTVRKIKIPPEKMGEFIERMLRFKKELQEAQNNKEPRKTKIPLSGKPDREWIACFFKHWKEMMKNTFPKAEIQFDSKQILIIPKGDFGIRYIIPTLKCIEKVNSERPLQIMVDPVIAEIYREGVTANSL